MALHYDLPVYRDTFILIRIVYDYTQNFPRDYKYTLGQDMKHDSMKLIRSIYKANRTHGDKTKYLEDFMDNFEMLKLQIRLATELKLLSLKQQSQLHTLMESIGRQITGWRKKQANRL